MSAVSDMARTACLSIVISGRMSKFSSASWLTYAQMVAGTSWNAVGRQTGDQTILGPVRGGFGAELPWYEVVGNSPSLSLRGNPKGQFGQPASWSFRAPNGGLLPMRPPLALQIC